MPIETSELLRILACPKCLGDLKAFEENGAAAGFVCHRCKVVYPVRDNIPVMLVEEAQPIDDWKKEHPTATERN